MGYIDQLNREGRVTFGSQVLQLDDAQQYLDGAPGQDFPGIKMAILARTKWC